MINKLLILFTCLNVYSLELEVGGRKISLHQNEALTSNQSETFKINEEITYLTKKNESLRKILESNEKNYKSNPDQKTLLLSVISKNTEKIKTLKYEISSQNFKKNKGDKALVSNFASFLDTCSSDLSNCKKEVKIMCSASFKKEVIFKKMVSTKSECLNERLNFIKSSKMKITSSGDFLKDLDRNKVIEYKLNDQAYKIAEINNCIAITTVSGHDRNKYNTHSDSNESCLEKCKSLYSKKLLNYKNSALACFSNDQRSIRSLGIISKKSSLINKLWNSENLNSHLNKDTINLHPNFNKAGELTNFTN